MGAIASVVSPVAVVLFTALAIAHFWSSIPSSAQPAPSARAVIDVQHSATGRPPPPPRFVDNTFAPGSPEWRAKQLAKRAWLQEVKGLWFYGEEDTLNRDFEATPHALPSADRSCHMLLHTAYYAAGLLLTLANALHPSGPSTSRRARR